MFCQHHTDRKIEMFCEDHSKLCCALCHFHEHRQCAKLVLIKEKSTEEILDEFHQISTTIAECEQNLETAIGDAYNWLKTLQDSYEEANGEIKDFRTKINNIFDELEKKTINSLDDMYHTIKKSIQLELETCSRIQDEFKRFKDVHKIKENPSNELVFVAYQTSLDNISQAKIILKEMAVNANPTISFENNPDFEQSLIRFSSIGNFKREVKQLKKSTNELIKCSNKVLYNVRVPSDSRKCDIRSICELPKREILILDYANSRVKLLNKQYKVVSHADLPESPYDMCSISPSEVAITITDGQKGTVKFLSVNNGQIVTGRTFSFEHKCHGIAHAEGHLYIASCTELYQYTMDCTLVKKIYEDSSDNCSVFKCAISPDGTHLYVTDRSRHKLLTLSKDGTLKSKLLDSAHRRPGGLHVSETGQLLACWSEAVVQVDGEGRMVTLASKEGGLNCTESVYYNARTGKVVVGHTSDSILVITTI
ncbi:uncharacterized protein LOC127851509 isoform X2 [Dreissena polymorpha]|nr:uncharacterized protein LOC127851509 isoform X2 [Dreissena polymorpha]